MRFYGYFNLDKQSSFNWYIVYIRYQHLLMNSSLLVVGSTNTDMVVKAPHLPAPGETIIGGDLFMNPGGKGANQAVAAKRLGGDVVFITKVGNDLFGQQSLRLFKEEGINTDYIIADPAHPSGVALITVDKKGENCIVVASGANAHLQSDDLQNAVPVLQSAAIVLMQLEIPVETVAFVTKTARANGAIVILNPAPACELPDDLFKNISIITPNEKEAEMLSGIPITDQTSVEAAADRIRAKGVETVIITLGSRGAFVCSGNTKEIIAAPEVVPIDTTAAGDVFSGALAVALAENVALKEAVSFACHAAALSVTQLGAQASAPYRSEVDAFIRKQKEAKVSL
jgi:ribokinase